MRVGARNGWRLQGTFVSLTALCVVLAGCSPPRSERGPEAIRIVPVTAAESQWTLSRIRAGAAPVLGDEPGSESEVTASCASFILSLPTGYEHGWVEVPENWNAPEGPKIRVFYYGSSRVPGSRRPVVAFFNGGPASDSQSSFEAIRLRPESADADFVFIDQRGTGCSSPYPADWTSESVARLIHYGTRSIVRDAEAVRERLLGAGSRWKVFGQSYGGMIVHRYLTAAAGSIASAHAHGFSVMKDSVSWLELRLRSQRRVWDDYLKMYPADEALLARVRAQVRADLCYTDGRLRACGDAILDGLTILLGFRDSWPELHTVLERNLLRENGALNEAGLEWFTRTYVFGVYGAQALAAAVLTKVEISPGMSDSQGCDVALERLRASGEGPETWALNECRLLRSMRNPDLENRLREVTFTDPLTLEQLDAALGAGPEPRFFLYSGRRDVFVPVETFADEVTRLGARLTYREFYMSGHEGFLTERAVWSDLLGE